jgi:hypothetical protein
MQDYRHVVPLAAAVITFPSMRSIVQDYRLHQDMLATITKLSGLTTTQLSGATESITA